MIAGVFVIMVAVSYPKVTVAVTATGTGIYALYRFVRTATHKDKLCIPRTHTCLQLPHRPK